MLPQQCVTRGHLSHLFTGVLKNSNLFKAGDTKNTTRHVGQTLAKAVKWTAKEAGQLP